MYQQRDGVEAVQPAGWVAAFNLRQYTGHSKRNLAETMEDCSIHHIYTQPRDFVCQQSDMVL